MMGATLTSSPSDTSTLTVNSDRLRADFDHLASIGATETGGVSRLALSPDDIAARSWFANRAEDAGLVVHDDDAGNLSAILPTLRQNARRLMVGSHLDTVPNGGRFDGSVGLLAALECLRVIKEHDIALPLHVEAINFTDDEGNWRSLMGSRALTGMLNADDFSDAKVDNALFRAALTRAGIKPDDVVNARRNPDDVAAYLELHVEHGTRLERARVPIGVVTNIVGRTTLQIVFNGQAGHSGTTDMYHRRDALRGAALFIVRAHDTIRARYGDGIFNCGDVVVKPGTFNIIPAVAELTVECRHVNATLLNEMETVLFSIARECATSYGLSVTTDKLVTMPTAAMDGALMEQIEQCSSTLGLPHMRLVSYAGHAAQFLAHFTPSAMIFIPSKDGIGHQPEEFTDWEHVEQGANVLLHTLIATALTYGQR